MTGDRYVAAVEMQLLDLPWRVRKNLVADLRVHLAEIPAQEDLVARLGTPQTSAGELRTAAGLAPRRGLIAFVRARRPRNVVIAVALVALGAAVAATVTWAGSYQPVTGGATGMNPRVSSQGALGEIVAPFRNGKPFQVGFSVRNSGRFAVRILDMPLTGFHPFVVRKFTARSDERGTGPPVRFQPFTLEPGQERLNRPARQVRELSQLGCRHVGRLRGHAGTNALPALDAHDLRQAPHAARHPHAGPSQPVRDRLAVERC